MEKKEKIKKVEDFRNCSVVFLSKINQEINNVFSEMLGFSVSLLAILFASILYLRKFDSVPILALLMICVFMIIHYVKKFVANLWNCLVLKIKNSFSMLKEKLKNKNKVKKV